MTTEEEQGAALARWLAQPAGTPPPKELDADVVEAILALHPERAPILELKPDDILDSITKGPLAQIPESKSKITVLFSGVTAASLAVAAVFFIGVLPVIQSGIHENPRLEPQYEENMGSFPAKELTEKQREAPVPPPPAPKEMVKNEESAAKTIPMISSPKASKAPLTVPSVEPAKIPSDAEQAPPPVPQPSSQMMGKPIQGGMSSGGMTSGSVSGGGSSTRKHTASSIPLLAKQKSARRSIQESIMEAPVSDDVAEIAFEGVENIEGLISQEPSGLSGKANASGQNLDALRQQAWPSDLDSEWLQDNAPAPRSKNDPSLNQALDEYKLGNYQLGSERLEPWIGPPPVFLGQHIALFMVQVQLEGGSLTEARRLVEKGLAMGSFNTPEYCALLVLSADILLAQKNSQAAKMRYLQAIAYNNQRAAK